ncbi:hypothetical protein BG004_007503 [Podila humilis]|nr:hypothetical protein BG004_007503 [Podila humilis]
MATRTQTTSVRPPATSIRPPTTVRPPTTSVRPPPTSSVPPPVTTVTTRTSTTAPPTRVITTTFDTSLSRSPRSTTSLNIGSSNEGSSNGGMSTGGVVGLAAGVLAVLIGSVVGAFLLLKQRKKRLMFTGQGGSRKYKGYPEPDFSRLPIQHYQFEMSDTKQGAGAVGVPDDNDDNSILRSPTLAGSVEGGSKRRIDVTSSYYDDEFNKANPGGYSESWTGYVAHGRRQGSDSSPRTPNSMGPLVTTSLTGHRSTLSSQSDFHEKGLSQDSLVHYTGEENAPQNLAHVTPLHSSTMAMRTPGMHSNGYGYEHMSPLHGTNMPMRPQTHSQDQIQSYGQQRPVSFAGHGPGTMPTPPLGPFMPRPMSPPVMHHNHPYQQHPLLPRQSLGRPMPPGSNQRPYSAFSTSGNLQQHQQLGVQHSSDLDASITSTTTTVQITNASGSLNPQLFKSEGPSSVVPMAQQREETKRISDSISTCSDSQTTRVSSPVFLPGDASRPLLGQGLYRVIPDQDEQPQPQPEDGTMTAGLRESMAMPLQSEKEEYVEKEHSHAVPESMEIVVSEVVEDVSTTHETRDANAARDGLPPVLSPLEPSASAPVINNATKPNLKHEVE